MNLRSVIYSAGWQENGSWHCPICKKVIKRTTIFHEMEEPSAARIYCAKVKFRVVKVKLLAADHVEQHSETDVVRAALNLRGKA